MKPAPPVTNTRIVRDDLPSELSAQRPGSIPDFLPRPRTSARPNGPARGLRSPFAPASVLPAALALPHKTTGGTGADCDSSAAATTLRRVQEQGCELSVVLP